MDSVISPRAYRSTLRTQQAAQTRTRILEAAAVLFSANGYQATTLPAIARQASVSVETVKGTAAKAELLIAAFEVTFSGTEAAASLTDTTAGLGLLNLLDDDFVDGVVARISQANLDSYALWTVLLGASLSDDIVRDALTGMLAGRAADFRALVDELTRRELIDPPVDRRAAADELSFLMSPESAQQLVAQSGWSPDRYREWLRAAVLAL